MTHNPAISAALALSGAPALAAIMRLQPPPRGIEGLLRVFARDPEAVADARAWCGTSREFLLQSVDAYVQRVLLHPGADPHRVLGGARGDSREALRHNMGLLLRGLHPDVASTDWRAPYARRVIDAWRAVGRGAAASASPETRRRGRPLRLPWVERPLHRPRRRRARWAAGAAVAATLLAGAYLAGAHTNASAAMGLVSLARLWAPLPW